MEDVWLLFSIKKSKAVLEDKYNKAHSVKDDVVGMYQAVSMHDYITFFKGANLIRNLYSITGPELFNKALRNYFKKYSFGNTDYSNLKEIFDNLISERDIKENPLNLIEPLLKNSGITKLSVDYTSQNGKIQKCQVNQNSSSEYMPVYYQFRTSVVLIYDTYQDIYPEITIKSSEKDDLDILVGKNQCRAILLNNEDVCYFRQTFSEDEISFFVEKAYVIVLI